MKRNLIISGAIGVLATGLLVSSCNKQVLDRPQLTSFVDDEFWRNETDIRLFANGFYSHYFVGYNNTWGVDYAPVRGYTFSDDLTSVGVQSHFENSVPTSRGSTSESTNGTWMTQYGGPTWNFAWVRKANIFIDRLQNVAQSNLDPEAYNHWLAVARFFRGSEYSRLVSVFGDIPYYDEVISDSDWDQLYKDRDDRGLVMDNVYDDFQFVLSNIRVNDGTNVLDRNVAAAFISRFMLFEGTFQHYHGLDAARATKYLELARDAAEIVMNSGDFSFSSDFKSLFSSDDLAGNGEVIMARYYDAALSITHHITSYNNGTETMPGNANLVLIKSFICNDGNVWQNSSVADADDFSASQLAITRDPRFEATFVDRPMATSSTLLYNFKHAPREALDYIGKAYPPEWGSNTNTTDAPVIRLAEVVLNWVEAKAVLAAHLGGSAVTQDDLDRSVNAIRSRPLDDAAIEKGVKKTAPLMLSALPSDPDRDADVPALIWEIRRERRMEFFSEFARLHDIKRWKKINYMDYSTNPDYFLGIWVNFPAEMPAYLSEAREGTLQVKKEDGTIVTYNGSNGSEMVGFYVVTNASNRNAFTDRVYMAPIGETQIVEYGELGYTLTQTTGWD
ncbi:MAG TPA: RagB/SusD family nutrient uptake outer membrane protein [Parapedobacter sp.]|uniref:RagB/SusD family nutrient uptake outer membrane protein n=1 Tax=Parapedobacter sp. TaxID=1958893 RepID=UPI002BAE3CDF|nr:RagB/SusD family nutrient uptake outer membrane protein [Parapedobacter sp.]HWK57270.1 RagB/SusD family nutrient uptake outer membrane protein [Parapedobacter sp.]